MRTNDGRLSNQMDKSHSIQYNNAFNSHGQPNLFYQSPIPVPIQQQISNSVQMNNFVFPQYYQYPNQVIMNPSPQPMIMPMTNNNNYNNTEITRLNSEDASVKSNYSQNQVHFTISTWDNLSPYYKGEKPTAGQLTNGKYFTQRSVGKDIYMVFDSKSDYINNFINHYFSTRNFTHDEKLLEIMNDQGIVEISDLIKFPRLTQIDTKIDDVVEALKINNFVNVIKMSNSVLGVQRADGWYPKKFTDNSNVQDAKDYSLEQQPPQQIFKQLSLNNQNEANVNYDTNNLMQNQLVYINPVYYPPTNIMPNPTPNLQLIIPTFSHPQIYPPNQTYPIRQYFSTTTAAAAANSNIGGPPTNVSEYSGHPISYNNTSHNTSATVTTPNFMQKQQSQIIGAGSIHANSR